MILDKMILEKYPELTNDNDISDIEKWLHTEIQFAIAIIMERTYKATITPFGVVVCPRGQPFRERWEVW